MSAIRIATVVLPVPGLPVNDMWSVGAWLVSPRSRRSLSTRRRAAISRMRAFTGLRPTSSRSSWPRISATPDSAKVRARSMVGAAGAFMSGLQEPEVLDHGGEVAVVVQEAVAVEDAEGADQQVDG